MKKFLLMCFLFAFAVSAWAQERTISGRVTSTEDGSSLPGVNVILKGTSVGTATDSDGRYSLSVPATGGVLIFSFIGLESREVPIGDRAVIDVSLALDVTQLSEVVVTALGLESDASRIGSATSKVGGTSAKQSGETGLIQGLSGKASSVLITKTSGDPGAGAYIQIRGQSTITSSVQPLIVVDGVPTFNTTATSTYSAGGNIAGVVEQSRMNDLNPNDIESVQILKGASAAALWGSRAANGVIMITTKKGAAGKNKKFEVVYGATYSVDKISYKHKLQDKFGQGDGGVWNGGAGISGSWGDKISDRDGGSNDVITDFGQYFNDDGDDLYRGYFVAEDGTTHYDIVNKNDTRNYDNSNFDQVFQNGHFLEQNISLSSGSDRGSVFVSVSHLDQEGIIRSGSDYKRTTFRINATNNISDQLKVSTNFSYAKINSNRIQTGSNLSGLYLGFLRTPADFDNRDYKGTYYDGNGTPTFDRQRAYRNAIGSSWNPRYNNPGWTINEQKNPNGVDRFVGNFEIEAKPTTWLKFIARPGVDFYEDRRSAFFPKGSADNAGAGVAVEEYLGERQLNFDGFAVASFKLTDKISGTGLIGTNFNQRDFVNNGSQYQNFILNLPISNNDNATNENTFPFDFESTQRTSAGYATLNLGYEELIYLNASVRVEAASTFGSKAQSTFTYPSADIAFNFTQLPALQNNSILNAGKLRVAYGEVGIQPVPYATKDDYVVAAYTEGWGPAISAGAYTGSYARSITQGNDELRPERKKEYEIGTDLSFLDSRINLNATYYYNKTTDALFNVGIAPSTGYSFKYDNAASLENKGIELDLNATILKIGDFSWDINVNWNRNRNKVLSLSGTESLFLDGFEGSASRAVVGQPVGVIWGGRWDRDADGELILDANGFPTVAANEGILGDPNPDWRGGLGTTLRYKGFRLYALFETFQGADMWAGTFGALHFFGRAWPTGAETTLTAAEAGAIVNIGGDPVTAFGTDNGNGTYTFRGNIGDFGNGPVALEQSWYQGLGGGFGPVAEQFVVDGSWTRLRELTLSYTLASDAFRKMTKLTSVDFTLTGRNLAIWAPAIDKIGVDPETNLTGPTNGRGLEYFNNPGTKSFLFSVRITY
jgi:TonB-linked SusC/RagA family outer membrane protein